MNFPNWPNLIEFTQWYIQNGYPQILPSETKIYQTDVSLSVCVFKHQQYQVEFYIARPNFISSKHYHTFEQMIVLMGGTGRGRRGNSLDEESDWVELNTSCIGRPGTLLKPDQWHQIESYGYGLYFYNCQKWPKDKSISSAVVEYYGDSLGPLHDQIKTF